MCVRSTLPPRRAGTPDSIEPPSSMRTAARMWTIGRTVSVLADGLALDLDLDLLADHHAAGLEGHVVGQAPVLAVDLGGRADTEDLLAVRAGGGALELDDELDRLGHVLDGELTVQDELGARVRLDAGAAELHRRVLLRLEEVTGTQVVVPVDLAGLNAGGDDGRG